MKDKNKTLEDEQKKTNEDFQKIQKINKDLNEKLNKVPQQNVILYYNYYLIIGCISNYIIIVYLKLIIGNKFWIIKYNF